ncbi:engB [Symbiodinium sp. CCMP2592]|nr:engB [Symbiodinium sp. CCMP2592]
MAMEICRQIDIATPAQRPTCRGPRPPWHFRGHGLRRAADVSAVWAVRCSAAGAALCGALRQREKRHTRVCGSRASGRGSGPRVVEDGTLMGDRPKVRYMWQVPQAASPELVLAGRSNAGKSTLLNAVLGAAGAKKAAPMSSKGGRTRTLNWYPIGFKIPLGWTGDGVRVSQQSDDQTLEDELRAAGEGCCLVDCFGLGEVEYSDLKAKRLQTWGPLLQKFLSERRALKTLCHLISSEQEGQLSPGDQQLVDIFRRSEADRSSRRLPPLRYVVVLTKTDLYESPQVAQFQEKLRQALLDLGQPPADIVSCTSLSRKGIKDFQTVVNEAVRRGWDHLDEWKNDATKERRLPQGRNKYERRNAKAAYTSTAKQSARQPSRGGKGTDSGTVVQAITCCVDLDRRAITYMKNGREIPGDAFNLSKDLHGWALFPHVYTKEATFSVSFDGRGGAPPLVGGYQWLAQAEKGTLSPSPKQPRAGEGEEDLEDGAASTSGGFVLTAYGWRNAAEVGVPMVSGAYAPLTQSAAQTGLSMNCCQILAVILANALALPLQILALPFQLLFILLMPLVSFCSALSLRRRAATIDGRAEDPLVAQTWGSLEELLSRPAVTVDVSATWPMVVLAALLLPMILVNNMLAIWIPPYFAHIARMAKWHQLSATGCGKVLFSWYYWNWHLLFGTLIAYMGQRRVSVYAFEGEAQGGGDYWWHGQGYFTGTHALVDQLAMGAQDRGLGRAAFDAVIPEVFPLDSIIFLPNGHEATSKWAETRKVMHDFWLSEQGPNYAQRVGHLKGLLKESWSNPSLDNLANIKVASVLVSRCVFYVFFGHWLTDEEANVMSRWARDAPLLVTPRFMHRLMFNFFVHQCKDLRAETIALISKHKLGHVFSTMNSSFSSANRRKYDIDLCNELMFVIGFAGIGGPSRAAASVAKFLLAQQSEDQAGVTFGGANSHLMIALYKKDPKAFIMETCRISSPVGTFTTRLTASAAKELGLGLDLGTAQETHLAGVINVSNVDPRKFPEPHKFDPSRPNLPDALTWNGKAFSSRECDYPRLCPGRELSIQIVKTLTEVALEGTGS